MAESAGTIFCELMLGFVMPKGKPPPANRQDHDRTANSV
jgi:hypothetical protein